MGSKKKLKPCPHCGHLFADGFEVPHAEVCGRMDDALRGAQKQFNEAADRVRGQIRHMEEVVREPILNELDNASEDIEAGIALLWEHMKTCHGPTVPGSLDAADVRRLRSMLLDGLRDNRLVHADGSPNAAGETYSRVFEYVCTLLGESTSTCGDCEFFTTSAAPRGARCVTESVAQDMTACKEHRRA